MANAHVAKAIFIGPAAEEFQSIFAEATRNKQIQGMFVVWVRTVSPLGYTEFELHLCDNMLAMG